MHLFDSRIIYREKLNIHRDMGPDLFVYGFLQGLQLGSLHRGSVQFNGASLAPQVPGKKKKKKKKHWREPHVFNGYSVRNLWFYQDVVLYPKSVSAKAVIKCWPKSQKENDGSLITTRDHGHAFSLIKELLHHWACTTVSYRLCLVHLTWVLLHVVKPPLPVHLHLHLLTFLQRWAHKVYSLWPLPRHPHNWDISNQPMIIWLEKDNTTHENDLTWILLLAQSSNLEISGHISSNHRQH